MPWSKSFGKNTKNVDLKPGLDVTNEISYNPSGGWTRSSEAEVNLVDISTDVRKETIKFDAENKIGAVTLAGPSAGAELGLKTNLKRTELAAMAELSAARAEGTLKVTDRAGVFGSANLNANTGAKVGPDGVEVNLLGFGVNMGVGGKWTINSPIGSIGASINSEKVKKLTKR